MKTATPLSTRCLRAALPLALALAAGVALVADVPPRLAATAPTEALTQSPTQSPTLAPTTDLAAWRQVREQRLAVTPSDPRFGEQWWLQEVAGANTGVAGFATAWQRSTGVAGAVQPGAVVAVLDTGITSHIETNARVLPGFDFVSDSDYAADGNGRDNDPQDPGDAVTDADRAALPAKFGGCPQAPRSSWHGTTIAGQLAAVTNNTEGVAAAQWQALVVPVRVAGKCGASVGDIIDGLRWAAGLPVTGVPANANPARLIVLSYGSADACDAGSSNTALAAIARQYEAALAEVRATGALVIVAAGNQRAAVGRPASCAGAFAVTAVNRAGYKAAYANFGAAIRLATPGGDDAAGGDCSAGDADLRDGGLVSTGNLGAVLPGAAGYVKASGTSFAGPGVAAVASLMLAVNPALSLAQIERGLVDSARPHVQVPLLGDCAIGSNPGRCACTTATCGAGLLDADQALAYAAAPATWVAPARTPTTLADDRLRACAVALGRTVDPVVPTPTPTPEPTPTPTPTPDPAPASGGGGALQAGWLLGLLVLVAALGLARRQPGLRAGDAQAAPSGTREHRGRLQRPLCAGRVD